MFLNNVIKNRESRCLPIFTKTYSWFLNQCAFGHLWWKCINFNSRYVENIRKVAELTKDQPMTGLEKAVWWTEYVIRHKGALHFKNPMNDLPIYQAYLLDVMGFIIIVDIIILYLVYKVIICVKYFLKKYFSCNDSKLKRSWWRSFCIFITMESEIITRIRYQIEHHNWDITLLLTHKCIISE